MSAPTGVNKIYCLTQFNSASLNRHLSSAYVSHHFLLLALLEILTCLLCGHTCAVPCFTTHLIYFPNPPLHTLMFLPPPHPLLQNANVGGYNSRGFVEVLAASQTTTTKEWFQGTADAVRQYMWLFDEACRDGVEDFLILSGESCC
jgi:ADP-glucose pyrophosphorylase